MDSVPLVKVLVEFRVVALIPAWSGVVARRVSSLVVRGWHVSLSFANFNTCLRVFSSVCPNRWCGPHTMFLVVGFFWLVHCFGLLEVGLLPFNKISDGKKKKKKVELYVKNIAWGKYYFGKSTTNHLNIYHQTITKRLGDLRNFNIVYTSSFYNID